MKLLLLSAATVLRLDVCSSNFCDPESLHRDHTRDGADGNRDAVRRYLRELDAEEADRVLGQWIARARTYRSIGRALEAPGSLGRVPEASSRRAFALRKKQLLLR